MIGSVRSLAPVVAGLGVAMLLATSPPASTASTATATATGEVQDLTFPVEDLIFGEANADGSLTDLGTEIRVAADVLFTFDKADLSPTAGALVADTAARITESGVTSITVTGHTDNQGSDSYNQRLSQRRAQAVRAALARAIGRSVTITARGLGESEPIADNATEQGQALNRRVQIGLG